MNEYQLKRQARIDRLQNRADNAANQANALHSRARDMASIIPFGQPILVGHHSEGRDRNYRGKITRTFERSFETLKKAQELDRRAEAAASNTNISSDDPEAVERLQEKLDALEAAHKQGLAYNKALKKKDMEAMKASGHKFESHGQHMKGFGPDIEGSIYLQYSTANSSANIRNVKLRLEKAKKLRNLVQAATIVDNHSGEVISKEACFGSVIVRDNVSANRVQIIFPQTRVSKELYLELKRNSFKRVYSDDSRNLWQNFRKQYIWESAEKLAEKGNQEHAKACQAAYD